VTSGFAGGGVAGGGRGGAEGTGGGRSSGNLGEWRFGGGAGVLWWCGWGTGEVLKGGAWVCWEFQGERIGVEPIHHWVMGLLFSMVGEDIGENIDDGTGRAG
jgi:hypothetical protein